MKAQLYRERFKEHFEIAPYGSMETLLRLHRDVKHLDPLSQMLYIDTRANLPDDLLMVADKTFDGQFSGGPSPVPGPPPG